MFCLAMFLFERYIKEWMMIFKDKNRIRGEDVILIGAGDGTGKMSFLTKHAKQKLESILFLFDKIWV